MKTLVWEGTITALTSISHIGETYGVTAKLRREKVAQPDGSVEEVPIISGNALRGILRDRGMLHMLRCLGYGVNDDTGEVRGLSLAAFYFLFSGGALTKITGRGLDVETARKWREAIPLVAIFGGAMGNQIMPGKIKVGKAIPICQETAHLIPERFVNGDIRSIWALCQEEAYTRRDDEKNEELRKMIAPEVRLALDAGKEQKRIAIESGEADDVADETGQKQQMRNYVETLVAGTRFYWDITLDDVTDIEFEAFLTAMLEFSRLPYIGGKSGVGHGKVHVQFDAWMEIDPRIKTGKEIDVKVFQRYEMHLRENAGTIRRLLDELA